MREIKFRAWDKKKKEMITYFNLTSQGCAKEPTNLGWVNESIDLDVVLMQYTGLKDKNGVEIYEGDIVKATKSNPYSFGSEQYKGINGKYEIIFCEGNFTIYKSFLMMQDTIKFMGLEIIGNIHSNPDLLNKES